MNILWWHRRLPCHAQTVATEWPIKEGGVRACARTDAKGKPYLCIGTLNTIGKTTGLPTWLCSDQFKSDMVVGFVGDRPLVMNVRVKVLRQGVELIIRMPNEIKSARDFIERRFTPWGSDAPSFSLMLSPTFEPHAASSFSVQ